MGWTDSHLHRFFAGRAPDDDYFVTEYDVEEGDDGTPEAEARLDQVLREPGDRIRYEYDFGDGWDHELRLETVGRPRRRRPATVHRRTARLSARGRRRRAVGTPTWRPGCATGGARDDVPPPFESAESAADWLPPDWHPDAFDVEETDLLLQALVASGELLERLRPDALGALLRLSPHGAATSRGGSPRRRRHRCRPADLDELAAPYRRLLAVDRRRGRAHGVRLPAATRGARSCAPRSDIDPILARQGEPREQRAAARRCSAKVGPAGGAAAHVTADVHADRSPGSSFARRPAAPLGARVRSAPGRARTS